ncbi:MAG TPA: hypothetical protein VM008_17180, partial [Phycisphaerae bacterium]|nr:hypothetical protein [Phycisphaerae bacterium]
YGTIFEIPAGTNSILTLANFNTVNGAIPMGNLVIDSSGNLFGATSGGGLYNRGTLWELKKSDYTNPDTLGNATITNLWNFTGNKGGAYPDAGVVFDSSGNLWGTTFGNGNNYANVFEFNVTTLVYQSIYTFTNSGDHINSTLATDANGTLVRTDANGTISTNGTFVYGALYQYSGDGDGEIFRLGVTGGNYGYPLYLAGFNQNNNDSSLPVGKLLFLDTTSGTHDLVGITVSGGHNGLGTIFDFPITTSNPKIRRITYFSNTNTVGSRPVGSLFASGSNGIYTLTGVTTFGGPNGNGGVYQYPLTLLPPNASYPSNPVGPQMISNITLTDQTGINPTGGLTLVPANDSTGKIFFTTANKGPLTNGSIIELDHIPSPSDRLSFTNQPSTVTAGSSFGSITIKAQLSNGSLDTAPGTVTLSIATGPFRSNITLATANLVGGFATFSNLTLTQAGNYTLSATLNNGAYVQSNQFNINPAAAAKLVIFQQPTPLAPIPPTPPTTGTTGKPLAPTSVKIEDQYGNLVTSNSSQVTISILSGPSGGKIANNKVNANRGIALFNNLQLSPTGTFKLQASDGSLTKANFAPITIGAVPSALAFGTLPASPAIGQSFTITLRLTTPNHATIATANANVTLSLASQTNGLSLFGTFTVQAVNGIATFRDLTLYSNNSSFTTGSVSFRASSPNLSTITSALLTIIAKPTTTV